MARKTKPPAAERATGTRNQRGTAHEDQGTDPNPETLRQDRTRPNPATRHNDNNDGISKARTSAGVKEDVHIGKKHRRNASSLQSLDLRHAGVGSSNHGYGTRSHTPAAYVRAITNDRDASERFRRDGSINFEEYKTAYDCVWAPMPKIPPVYSRSRINETKETTQSELSFDGKDIINYIVYRPAFLDSLDQDGKKLLMDIRLNRDNVHHMGFLHLVLPEYATCLLSRSIFSEKDVVDWWMLTIFRPAFLFLRWVIIATDLGGARDCMKDVNPLSDEPQWHYPNMCSSKSDKFIPDGLLVNDITIINGIRQPDVIICSFEVKSQQAWGAELFAELTQMPQQISIDAAHTHRFGWPHSPLETAKSKLNRMLIQVWSHLVKRGAHVAFLTCHTRTIVMKRVDNMLYLSREYMYDEDLPVFTVFSVLAFECRFRWT